MQEASKYLSEQENIQQLNDSVLAQHQILFQNLRCNRVDPGFVGKIYVVFTPNGHGLSPSILGQIKILDWTASAKNGPSVTVENMETGRTLVIGCIPVKLFDYDVFMSCAPYSKLRYDVRITQEQAVRSVMFSLLIKTESRTEQLNDGHIYCESLKPFKALFPTSDFAPSYF